MICTHLEDIGKESRADPLTCKVIKARKTGEGTDQSPVGWWPHPAHLDDNKKKVGMMSKGAKR